MHCRRRGSELNLADFRTRNIEFIHGDVRFPRDLESLTGPFDLLIDAAADPSVHAATNAIDTNRQGTLNCLECAGALLFRYNFLPQTWVDVGLEFSNFDNPKEQQNLRSGEEDDFNSFVFAL